MYSHTHFSLIPTITLNFLSSPLLSSPQTMLDLTQGLAGNHQSCFSPVSRSNDSCSTVSTWTAEFDFWGEQRTQVYDCSGYARVELRAQTQYGGGDDSSSSSGACSPPLWMSTSPLLPCNHCYSYPSPKSRLQAIVDGRRELMEMIKDLPESSFELSLKDIVDDQHIFQADQKDTVIEERSLNFKPEVKTKQQKKTKKKKKKSCRRVQMSRSESMDSGVFLLKMFFPISLGLRRTGNRSKVSPRPSLEGSEKIVNKGYWWKIRLLVMGESKNSGSSRLNGSTSGGGGRHEDVNYTPGCWSFHKKYRSSKEGGCLL